MWKVIQPQDDDRACPGIPTLNKGIGCKSFFLSMKKPQASHRILGTEAMVADRKKKKKAKKPPTWPLLKVHPARSFSAGLEGAKLSPGLLIKVTVILKSHFAQHFFRERAIKNLF